MTDPDPESVWLLFGPLNALIYGVVAYTLWLLLMGGVLRARTFYFSWKYPSDELVD